VKPPLSPDGNAPLRIIPLGGLGEIGLNLMVITHGDTAIAIDCGVMFPDEDMLGVDLAIPDTSYLRACGESFRAIFLTHGHEDHIGSLPYVLRDHVVPVYGTPMTLGLVRERLAEHGLVDAVQLYDLPLRRPVEVGPFAVEALRVTHSMVDSVALAIRTPVGTVIHTGDFKIDQTPLDGAVCDLKRLAEYGDAGVLALLSDSTNVERTGFTPSEREVGGYLDRIFSGSHGRIFVATFASHLHRIQQVLEVSHRFGRRVALAGRSLTVNVAIATELGRLRPPAGALVDLAGARELGARELTVLATGSQGEPLSALARIAMNDHPQIQATPDDLVVLSSRIIPGKERAISNLVNHFYRRGAEVITERVAPCHVSGHASQEELKLILALTRPRYFVPIHGEYRHLFQHCRLARDVGLAAGDCFLLEDGHVLELSPTGARRADSVTAGRVLVDGKGVGDVGDLVLRDRRHLSADGLVLAILAMHQQTGEIIAGPDLVSRGVFIEDVRQDYLEQARAIILDAVSDMNPESRTDPVEVKEEVRKALRRFFKRTLGRRPVILPFVVEM
jgi:ribonuclease J